MEERKINKPENDILTQNNKSKSKKPVFIAVVSVVLAIAIAVGVYLVFFSPLSLIIYCVRLEQHRTIA